MLTKKIWPPILNQKHNALSVCLQPALAKMAAKETCAAISMKKLSRSFHNNPLHKGFSERFLRLANVVAGALGMLLPYRPIAWVGEGVLFDGNGALKTVIEG